MLTKTIDKIMEAEISALEVFKDQEELKTYFEAAFGYVVFDKIGKGGVGIGGAYGNGSVYKNNMDGSETLIGTSQLVQVSMGFQFGGQFFSEIIFFEEERDMERFLAGPTFEFEADVNVVALKAHASASASTMGNTVTHSTSLKGEETKVIKEAVEFSKYVKGLAVFSIPLKGLMYQMTVAGQKFTYKPIETSVEEEKPSE